MKQSSIDLSSIEQVVIQCVLCVGSWLMFVPGVTAQVRLLTLAVIKSSHTDTDTATYTATSLSLSLSLSLLHIQYMVID